MTDIERSARFAAARESEKRLAHTRGVASDCERLAELFGLDPETAEKLVIAGWLHDCTKELSPAGQRDLCVRSGSPEPPDGYVSPTLHAITAAHLALSVFPEFVDDVVFSAMRKHTTGAAEMSLVDMLLCFADYTEESRRYETCRRLREKFYGMAEKTGLEGRKILLAECLAQAFDATIASLSKRGDYIDNDTYEAKTGLLRKLAHPGGIK